MDPQQVAQLIQNTSSLTLEQAQQMVTAAASSATPAGDGGVATISPLLQVLRIERQQQHQRMICLTTGLLRYSQQRLLTHMQAREQRMQTFMQAEQQRTQAFMQAEEQSLRADLSNLLVQLLQPRSSEAFQTYSDVTVPLICAAFGQVHPHTPLVRQLMDKMYGVTTTATTKQTRRKYNHCMVLGWVTDEGSGFISHQCMFGKGREHTRGSGVVLNTKSVCICMSKRKEKKEANERPMPRLSCSPCFFPP